MRKALNVSTVLYDHITNYEQTATLRIRLLIFFFFMK